MPSEVSSTEAIEATANPATAAPTETSAPVTSGESAPANGAGTGAAAPDGSLTPPISAEQTSTTQTTAQPQAPNPANAASGPTNDWQKRYTDLQSYTDRKLNAAKAEMQQHAQELAELRQLKQQQQEQAERLQLKRWSKSHPEHSKFQGVLTKAQTAHAQIRAIPADTPPETKAAMEQVIMSALSPDEQQELHSYQEEITNFQRGFFQDPQGTLAPMIIPMIQEQLRAVQAQSQAHQRVAQDFESPELQPLVAEHAPELKQALADGVPYDYGVHMLKMFGELKNLRSQIQTMSREATMGKEQVRLAQGAASITRDPAPVKTVDVYALAKKQAAEKGFSTADPRFLSLLSDLEKSHSS